MKADAALLIRDNLLEAIEATQDEWEPGGQRASATGHCMRKQWYQITDAPRSRVSAGSLIAMNDGNIHEDDVVRWLQAAGYTVRDVGEQQQEIAIPLTDGSYVTGHPDGIINGRLLYTDHLLEVKAMGAFRYVKFARASVETGGNGMIREFPDYNMQVQLYMFALDLAACVFAVKAKDSSATKRQLARVDVDPTFHMEIVERDYDVIIEALDRHEKLRKHLLSGTVPEREYKRSDWQCRFCDNQKWCWEGVA